MTNEDLKRLYPDNPSSSEPFDFARLDANGKIPAGNLPSTVDLYQHNIAFSHTTDTGLTYSMSFLSNDPTEIEDLDGLLAAVFALYDEGSFGGVVTGTGTDDYANPIGTFVASCSDSDDSISMSLTTPCFVTSTFTIDETEYSVDKIVINTIDEVTLEEISDTVVKLN